MDAGAGRVGEYAGCDRPGWGVRMRMPSLGQRSQALGSSESYWRVNSLTDNRLPPPQVVQTIFVKTHVVAEFVHDGDPDLVHQVVEVLGHQAQRDPVQADPVR